MMVLTLELLTTHFPSSRHNDALRDTLNRKVGQRWDALRWFLGIHYRFNKRLDTPFWRAANDEADVSGAEERVALYRERAPLSYRTSLFYPLFAPEFFSDDHSFDTLLMGLDVPARYVEPIEHPATWERRRSSLLRTASAALPQAEALAWLREHTKEQERLVSEPLSWLHRSLPA
jgi:tryptophan halogenase